MQLLMRHAYYIYFRGRAQTVPVYIPVLCGVIYADAHNIEEGVEAMISQEGTVQGNISAACCIGLPGTVTSTVMSCTCSLLGPIDIVQSNRIDATLLTI
jgi:hypothetical protein